MTKIHKISEQPEIWLGRDTIRTVAPIYFAVGTIALVVAFGLLLRTHQVIDQGNSKLTRMQDRLNDLNVQMISTEQACTVAATLCSQ